MKGYAALIAALVLTAPAALRAEARRPSRFVPEVTSSQYEKPDPDTRREPAQKDLITLLKHVADLVTDKNTRKEEVSGVDFFMDRLQEKLAENGSDVPRYGILMNARDGRDMLRQGYDDLRRAVEPMLEARDKLLEVQGTLEKVNETNDRYVQAERKTSDAMKATVGAMDAEAEPPESSGEDVDPSELHPIEDLGRDIEPLEKMVESAGDKVGRAKSWIQSVDQKVKMVRIFAETAKTLDEKAVDRLAERRTRREKDMIRREDSSHFVLKNSNEWLEKAFKKAKEIHELMEKLTKPQEGFKKASEKATAANEKTQPAKEIGLASAERVNASHQRIKGPIREQWAEMEQIQDPEQKEKRKAELKEEAAQAKEKAEKAQGKADEATQAAEKAAEESRKAFEEATEKLEKIVEKLGDGDPRDFAEIPEYSITAKRPQSGPGATAGRGEGGKRVRSKPLKYPKVLDENANKVISDTYGEQDYGLDR